MADHKPGSMAEHKPGTMDIRSHEKTFAAFIRMVTWGGILCIVILIIIALADA
jgi:Ni,Fe-hydrogenase I cytochrome b subunit